MVTSLLVALGVGAYVSQMVITIMLPQADAQGLDGQGMLWRWLALDPAGFFRGEWWKALTFGFLHLASPFHVIGNMLLLFVAGREVEPIVGWRHFLAIYVLGGVVGGVAQMLAIPAVPLVGVSASVAAVVFAFCTILPELEVRDSLFSIIPIRLRARHLALAVALTCAVLWWSGTLLTIGPVAMLVAGALAWVYVKQLGFGNPLAIQRYIFARRERAARLERMSPEQFIRTQIDPILEKISREGMHRLTRAERKLLAQGSSKVGAKAGREE
jgi:membrane associated rhomboid family serine protease